MEKPQNNASRSTPCMVRPPKKKKIKFAANPKCRGATWKRREEKKRKKPQKLKKKTTRGKKKRMKNNG